MQIDKEQIKRKLYEKLPDLLPQLLKTVIVHIVMMICHISMPPWVTVMKVKKKLKSHKNINGGYTEELETDRRMRYRSMRHRRHRRM